jgi:SAM-dependent methyltransferase
LFDNFKDDSVYFRILVQAFRDIWSARRPAEGLKAAAGSPQTGYSPAIFHTSNLEAAKAVILNPVPDMTTDQRWEVETQNLAGALAGVLKLDKQSCILDYGCGVGRVAKALIDRYECSVVGVDISAEMRRLAVEYVKSDRFSACEPAMLDRMIAEGFRATGAYACWVLQHCQQPARDIERIDAALAPGAPFYVLNSDHRWVPTDRGWASDDVSIEQLLAARFDVISKSGVSDLVGSRILASESYAMVLKARE